MKPTNLEVKCYTIVAVILIISLLIATFILLAKLVFIAIDGYQDTKNINKRLINEIKIEKYVRNLGNKNFRI
ncbi:MAG: hypothetical protein IKO41_16055 [Lachnospiraceae bacterium]|nr:hypothetical protein [Lachnospiraceae bacterium]